MPTPVTASRPAPRPTTRSPRPETPVGPWVDSPALKPQALPTPAKTTRRTTKRAVRAVAERPAPATELSPEVRDQLLAAVCVPRPVFIADLVNLVGSADVVAAWEEEFGASADLAVRFIGAKSRHRARGALVFPQEFLRGASQEFTQSLWARVLAQFTGAKAYELGVLLHRFNEEVVSDELGPHVVTLHLSRPQGLIGVIVVVDASLGEGAPTRLALVESLESMMRERLVQIAVLAINTEVLDTIAAVVAEEAAQRQWRPTAPVTLSKSWDYATSTGVAIPLLGA